MKTFGVFVGIIVLTSIHSHGQIISKSSNSLSTKVVVSTTKIQGVSNVFTYNLNDYKGLHGISNTLYFGINSASQEMIASKTTEKTSLEIKKETTITKQEVQPSNNTIKKEEAPTISEPTKESTQTTRSNNNPEEKRSVDIGKELGTEYVGAIPLYHALIIGVSDYTYSDAKLPSLERPVIDAQNVYNVLTQKYSFEPKNVKLLKNATRKEIIDALEVLSYDVKGKDNLLIFYAGHGVYDKIKEFGYWLPADARSSSRSEWIPNSQIKDYLSAIQSKHTLLITDACFGGSIFKSRAVDANTIIRINELYRDPSRKAITSGNLSEVPDKSPFIDFFLKKLNENEDVFLPAQKLFTRIYEPVMNNSSATPQIGVVQGAGDEGGDFIFIKKLK